MNTELYYNKYTIDKHMPLILRINTNLDKYKGILNEPYDFLYNDSFTQTVMSLSKTIPNFKFAFLGYDEAFLLLMDSDEHWLDYDIQSIINTTTSHCILTFYRLFSNVIKDTTGYYEGLKRYRDMMYEAEYNGLISDYEIFNKYKKLKDNPLTFSSKIYSIPIIKVIDFLSDRQEEYNIKMFRKYAKTVIAEEDLKDKTDLEIFEMLNMKNSSFRSAQQFLKTGICFSKKNNYVLDFEVPLFSKDREYIADSMID